jgi:hypothetical protein
MTPETFVLWWSGFKQSLRCRRILALCLAAICAAVVAVGVPNLRYFGQDVFIALDGGWRVLNGQRPAVDFLATMGPVWYLLWAGGMAVAGKSAIGLAWASGFAAVVIAAWSCLLLRRRMAPLPLFLACISLLLLASAPIPLGFSPWHTTFAMSYNRQGFALIGLVLLECFLPESEYGDTFSRFGGGFSTGLACAILLFLKISYGIVGVAVAGLSVALRTNDRRRMAGIAAGFLLAALPILTYLRFDVAALVRENRLLASVRGKLVNPRNISRELLADKYELAPVLLTGLLTILVAGIPARRRVMLGIACLTAAGAGTLLILGNAQPSGLPLIAVTAVLLANEITLLIRGGRIGAAQAAPLLCLALLSALLPVAVDVTGLGFAVADKAVHRRGGAHLNVPQLSSLAWFNDTTNPPELNENGDRIVGLIEEGMALTRANSRPDESVRGLAGTNPFSYAMMRPPSRGGAVSITDRKVSETVVPSLDTLFGDVDLILVPKFLTTNTETLVIILRRYPELLGKKYRSVAESTHWLLYRRAPDTNQSARPIRPEPSSSTP